MCDQTEIKYLDGEIVWVKLGSCWWPGQVVGNDEVPPDVLQSFRKPPIAIVKFFEEDTFEYIRNFNNIYKYQCSRKNEFIKKGLDILRSKHGSNMEKFPEDVIRAESHTDGDSEILKRDEFQEVKKESYAGLFGEPKTPSANTKVSGRVAKAKESAKKITPFLNRKRNLEYKVTYMIQNTTNNSTAADNSNHSANSEGSSLEDSTTEPTKTPVESSSNTPKSVPGTYVCHACPFTTSRLNVLILHNKTHSATFVPYKPTPKKVSKSTKTTPKFSKSSTADKKPPKLQPKKIQVTINQETEKAKAPKRIAEEKPQISALKKPKTEEEIKNSLLADWEDEWGDDKEDEVVSDVSHEVPPETESPAIPTSADSMAGIEVPKKDAKPPVESNDVTDSLGDAKYDFCEDEDWPLEADVGRKIPRVKNVSKHKNDVISTFNNEEDVAKEVADLLEKTTVPELPAVPDLLKVEENFPNVAVVKSPDKTSATVMETKISPKKDTTEAPVTKTIFKTKTFFRSRHSRSQDAIEKYVAEQLQNHNEKLDSFDCDQNGSQATSSSEPRMSPPVEPVKVARLAPKIELKRMKAEAQLKEKILLDELSAKTRTQFEPSDIEHIKSNSVLDHKSNGNEVNAVSHLEQLNPVDDIQSVSHITPINKILGINQKICEDSIAHDKPLNSILHNDIAAGNCQNHSHSQIEAYETIMDDKPLKDIEKPVDETFNKIPVNESPTQNKVCGETSRESPYPLMQNEVKNSENCGLDNISSKLNLFQGTENENITLNQTVQRDESTEQLKNNISVLANDPPIKKRIRLLSNERRLHEASVDKICKVDTEPANNEKVIETVSDSPKVYSKQIWQNETLNSNEIPLLENVPAKIIQSHETEINISEPNYVYDTEAIKDYELPKDNETIPINTNEINETQTETLKGDLLDKNSSLGNEPKSEISEICGQTLLNKEDSYKQNISNDNALLNENNFCEAFITEEIVNTEPIATTLDTQVIPKINEKDTDIINSSIQNVISNNGNINTPSKQITVFKHPTDNTNTAPTETERVTRVISNDPPDVLFEEDVTTTETDYSDVMNESALIQNDPKIANVQENLTIDHTFVESDISNTSLPQQILTSVPTTEVKQIEKDYNSIGIIKEKSTNFIENIPSESDLQVAEALINLPTTHKKSNVINTSGFEDSNVIQNQSYSIESNAPTSLLTNDKIKEPIFFNDQNIEPIEQEILSSNEEMSIVNEIQLPMNNVPAIYSDVVMNKRFETEEEKCENLNAAQSLVQMSEQISETCESKIQSVIPDNVVKSTILNIEATTTNRTNVIKENKTAKSSNILNSEPTQKSKLLRILEEPIKKIPDFSHKTLSPSHERSVGSDSIIRNKTSRSHQKVTLIRRNVPSKIITKSQVNESSNDNIVLSKTKSTQDGSSVQTYTIQSTPEKISPSDTNTLILQQSLNKHVSNPPKLQKIKPNTYNESSKKVMKICKNDDVFFDINSMPVVLSEDIVTAEDIEKMPFVITDGNIVTSAPNKITKTVIKEIEKPPPLISTINKVESVKATTPNIISKSTKGKCSVKPMLVIDKATGKQKILMASSESPIVEKEVKPNKSEKFIVLPQTNPRSGRTQKIVIDGNTGKAHMIVPKPSELTSVDNKPVSAKLIQQPPSTTDSGAGTSGTIMIITNAQGTQSKIVLTPEHEKILFPKKQRPNTQLNTVVQQRPSGNVVQQQIIQKQTIIPKQVLQKQNTIISPVIQSISPKPNKIVPKQQKSAIITSKGQLIVGGKLASTATTTKATLLQTQNPTMSTISKRVITSESTKTIRPPGEPLIFLQQKSGAIVQLTAAQFDHLQKTGQIVQKTQSPAPVIQDNKVVIQKSVTIQPGGDFQARKVKNRVYKSNKSNEVAVPPKRPRQEVAVPSRTAAPGKAPSAASTAGTVHSLLAENKPKTIVCSAYPELENFEELLPSTAIVKKRLPPKKEAVAPSVPVPAPAPVPALVPVPAPRAVPPSAPQPAPAPEPVPEAAAFADGQLVAVPCENFGGPPGSFYLCVEDNGTLTPIDNRPLILENDQLVPMSPEPSAARPERRDILEAALANSDVFRGEAARLDAPDFRDLNANVSVHCRVSETSTTLNQPIMTPVEMPTKRDAETALASTLEAGLAVIGATARAAHTVPTSLELPITVTDPRIAPRARDPLCPSPGAGPCAGPMSMPLLSEEDGLGKSMPILTDPAPAPPSPPSPRSPPDPADEAEHARGPATPGSDCSETSAEIPLQPALQFSVDDFRRNC